MSTYGVMTGIRVRCEADRLILLASHRLPEVAPGFSGGGFNGSRTPNAWRAGSRGRGRRRPFEADEAAHVVDEVRHADLAARANYTDGAHHPGSHTVLLITEYMLNASAHLRARRIGCLLRLH